MVDSFWKRSGYPIWGVDHSDFNFLVTRHGSRWDSQRGQELQYIYIYKVVYITCKSFFNKLCSIIALCKPKQKKQVQLGLSEKYWNTSKIPSSLVFFIVLMAINPHFVRPNPRRQQPSCRTYGIRTYGRASMTTLPEASW